MDFFNKIPVMDRTALRELKKGIDLSFKDFSRAYGDGIEGFFDPLLYFFNLVGKIISKQSMAPGHWGICVISLDRFKKY